MRRVLPFCLLVLSACSGVATSLVGPDAAVAVDVPATAVDVPATAVDVPAAPQVRVTAAIASASLADDCPLPGSGSGDGLIGCARRPDAGAEQDEAPRCGTTCRQTNLQLTFNVEAVGAPSSAPPSTAVSITRVRLLDAATDAELDTLTARDPQRWAAVQYVAWDGALTAYGETRASFKLSAPNWTRIGGGSVARTYGRPFRLEVTLRLGSETVVLRSGELTRAPEVDT